MTTPEILSEQPVVEEVPVETPSDSTDRKERKRTFVDVLGIQIPHARCETHLRNQLNPIIGNMKTLTRQLEQAKIAYKAGGEMAADKAIVLDLQSKIASISIRIANDTSVAVASVCDYALREIRAHAIKQTVAADRKIVEIAFIHDGAVHELLTYPIWRNLPVVRNYDPDREEELRKLRIAKSRVRHDVEGVADAAPVDPDDVDSDPGPDQEDAVVPAGAVADDQSDDGIGPSTSFINYVDSIFRLSKEDEVIQGVRISKRIRKYCSDLVCELIVRIADISKIIVRDISDVRTLNSKHVMSAIKILMVNEGRTLGDVDLMRSFIDDKVTRYHEHIAEKAALKWLALPEERRLKIEEDRVRCNQKRAIAKQEKKMARDAAIIEHQMDASSMPRRGRPR